MPPPAMALMAPARNAPPAAAAARQTVKSNAASSTETRYRLASDRNGWGRVALSRPSGTASVAPPQIFTRIFSSESGMDFGVDEEELQRTAAAFADAVWVIENHMSFTRNDDLVITAPPEGAEDRTRVWRDFLINAGVS